MIQKVICELVLQEKTDKEKALFKKYQKWLYSNWISKHIVDNFNNDLETLKLTTT